MYLFWKNNSTWSCLWQFLPWYDHDHSPAVIYGSFNIGWDGSSNQKISHMNAQSVSLLFQIWLNFTFYKMAVHMAVRNIIYVAFMWGLQKKWNRIHINHTWMTQMHQTPNCPPPLVSHQRFDVDSRILHDAQLVSIQRQSRLYSDVVNKSCHRRQKKLTSSSTWKPLHIGAVININFDINCNFLQSLQAVLKLSMKTQIEILWKHSKVAVHFNCKSAVFEVDFNFTPNVKTNLQSTSEMSLSTSKTHDGVTNVKASLVRGWRQSQRVNKGTKEALRV